MSASLVGSEMCIRDSHCLRLIPEQTREVTHVSVAVTESRIGGRRPLDSCLLYTSDAADDM
eukprot:6242578-Alexandrium_andersonii.AAC.1